MKTKICLILIIATSIFINGCGLLSKKYTKTHTDNFRINSKDKKKLKIDNVSGSITITRSDDSSAIFVKATKEIKVKKKYLETPFDEIEIKLDTISSIITVETEIGREGEDNVFKFNMDRHQRVDYEIRVPSGITIEIENIHGNITADDVNNDLKIDLVNGDVSIEKYSGRLECEITNGGFSGHIDSTRGINISSINGSITLYLNNYMNASLRAETVHGKITNENLEFRELIKEKRLFKGKLGSGEPNIDIRLETVNGKIWLIGRNEV